MGSFEVALEPHVKSRAALESLKRKSGDTQGAQKPSSKSESPLSSQMSALLFSPPSKAAKIDETDKGEGESLPEIDLDDSFDDALLMELDAFDAESSKNPVTLHEKQQVNTLAFCTDKPPLSSSPIYSVADSLYKSGVDHLPMIDFATPQIYSQNPAKMAPPPCIAVEELVQASHCEKLPPSQLHLRLLLPETFDIQDLKNNFKMINPSLRQDSVSLIKGSTVKKITFPLALMLRDFRQIGSMAQLRLIDGFGEEIVGSMPFSVCTELNLKLHYGLIFIFCDVSVFSPIPGVFYLNITKPNVQKFYYNARAINE